MDIAIIGAGNVGRALATSFSRAGHAVTIASRDPQDAAGGRGRDRLDRRHVGGRGRCRRRDRGPGRRISASSGEQLALEHPRRSSVARSWSTSRTRSSPPTTGSRPRAVHRPPSASPPGCRGPMSSRRSTHSSPPNQVDPIVDGTRLDGFVAGDDADAKATVLELVPIDRPAPHRRRSARQGSRSSRHWPGLNIALQGSLGNGWHTGWKLVGVPVGAIVGDKVAA